NRMSGRANRQTKAVIPMPGQALAMRRQPSADTPVEAIVRPYSSRLPLSRPPNVEDQPPADGTPAFRHERSNPPVGCILLLGATFREHIRTAPRSEGRTPRCTGPRA